MSGLVSPSTSISLILQPRTPPAALILSIAILAVSRAGASNGAMKPVRAIALPTITSPLSQAAALLVSPLLLVSSFAVETQPLSATLRAMPEIVAAANLRLVMRGSRMGVVLPRLRSKRWTGSCGAS